MFNHPDFDAHEHVAHIGDETCGLHAIVAVHSTARGPSSGGVRLWPYATPDEALVDVLRLSRAMSLKNAIADIPLGGGKAVVIQPAGGFADRTAAFAALGAGLDRLGGAYIAAEDVGVSPTDMDAIATRTSHVAGVSVGEAASGDPSPITARGVALAIGVCAGRVFGRDGVRDLRVAVQGVGHVGEYLCALLAEAGARLVVTDLDPARAKTAAERWGAEVVAPEEIYDQDVEVFAPCALGGAVRPDTIDRLRCRIVAGGANNQLATPQMGAELAQRGILFAPDFAINAGGIINIAAEVSGRYDPAWVEAKVDGLMATLVDVLDRSEVTGARPEEVAETVALERIAAAQAARAST